MKPGEPPACRHGLVEPAIPLATVSHPPLSHLPLPLVITSPWVSHMFTPQERRLIPNTQKSRPSQHMQSTLCSHSCGAVANPARWCVEVLPSMQQLALLIRPYVMQRAAAPLLPPSFALSLPSFRSSLPSFNSSRGPTKSLFGAWGMCSAFPFHHIRQ